MTIRRYSSRSQQTTLIEALNSSATEMVVNSASTLLAGITPSAGQTFTVAIDPDTALEEIVDIITPSSPGNNTLTISGRGTDGSIATNHGVGAVVKHMIVGRDLRESNLHIEAISAYNDGTGTHSLHGLGDGDGNVVGETKVQVLTNKTLTSPTIASFTNATHSHLNSAGGGQITAAAISDFQEVVEDTVGAMVSGNTEDGISITYDDSTGKYNFNVSDPVITIAGDVTGSATITNLTDTTITVAIPAGTIVNADINDGAAIARTKLNLGGTITSADLVDGTIVAADIADGTITAAKMLVDPYARANHTGTQTASTISDFNTQVRTNRLDQMAAPTAAVSANSQKITNLGLATSNGDAVSVAYLDSQKGIANGIAELDSNGKVPFEHIPATAVAEVFVVSSQAEMLALPDGIGDIAIRTDLNKSFIQRDTPATTLGNWNELLTPTDSVLSVDGITGAVDLTGIYLNKTTGVLAGNLDANTHKVTNLGTPTSNGDAATKAYVDTVAGSATAAAASAAAAATTYDNFDDRYLGAKSSVPTLDNDGNALITGALYWNSVSNTMFVWNGTAWTAVSSTADIYRYRYTATGGEISKSGADDNGLTLSYIVGKEQVYLNGVLLVRTTDYNATDGSSITGLAALTTGDILEVITFALFEVANVISPTVIDAKGDILVGTSADVVGKVTVGSNGQYLQADSSTSTGLAWATPSSYSAPTLGSTSIASGATVTTIADLTLTSPTISTITNTGTVTLPTATDTLVGRATTDTLTNKTLTDPKINLVFDAETASYTGVLANNGQVVTMDNSSANTFSIPTDASVAYPIGTQINVLQIGTGQTTIQAVTSGTTTILSTGGTPAAPKLRARYSMATCIKSATDTWYVVGDIS
jgi:hypothetical protein